MITHIDNFVKNLDKKEKIIRYLKTIYKIETGEEPLIPNAYIEENIDFKEEFYKKQFEEADQNILINQTFPSFKEKVDSLNLPSLMDKTVKTKIEKLRRMKDTKILIRKLDLSYYYDKGLSVELFKKVVDGLKILKSVESLNLAHNLLNDNYTDLICELFVITNLNRIDLSNNSLTKGCIKKLSNAIKNCTNLEYLDVSYNPFNNDEYSCLTVCSAVKSCSRLFHFGICDSSRDSAIRILSTLPDMRSLNLEDSRYRNRSLDLLFRYIADKKYQLSVLSLKFMTIDFASSALGFERALKLNRSLVFLNLYNTGICDFFGARIISALNCNKTMTEINLGSNKLSTEFCKSLGQFLKVNKIMTKVNIEKNYSITNENFGHVLEGLVENQIIISLGDLFDTKIGVKMRESAEKILNINLTLYDLNTNFLAKYTEIEHENEKERAKNQFANEVFRQSSREKPASRGLSANRTEISKEKERSPALSKEKLINIETKKVKEKEKEKSPEISKEKDKKKKDKKDREKDKKEKSPDTSEAKDKSKEKKKDKSPETSAEKKHKKEKKEKEKKEKEHSKEKKQVSSSNIANFQINQNDDINNAAREMIKEMNNLNTEISLRKSQKEDYFRSSIDFENWDKKKRENVDNVVSTISVQPLMKKTNDEPNLIETSAEIFEADLRDLMARYDINLNISKSYDKEECNYPDYDFQIFNNI